MWQNKCLGSLVTRRIQDERSVSKSRSTNCVSASHALVAPLKQRQFLLRQLAISESPFKSARESFAKVRVQFLHVSKFSASQIRRQTRQKAFQQRTLSILGHLPLTTFSVWINHDYGGK
jgi:hypothetical protein